MRLMGGSIENVFLDMLLRRQFRREAKGTVRAFGVVAGEKGIDPGVASRMKQVQSGFRAVAKKKVIAVPEQFKRNFKRKRAVRMTVYKKPTRKKLKPKRTVTPKIKRRSVVSRKVRWM